MNRSKITTDFFDVEKWLESIHITPSTTGPNISNKGTWIGIDCPFCEDDLQHLGINLDWKGFSCFKCGKKGNVFKLVMKLEKVSYNKCLDIIQEYSTGRIYKKEAAETLSESRTSKVSMQFETQLQDIHKKFLESRRFGPDTYIKYKMMCSGELGDQNGKYRYRLIIPSIQNNIVVNFIARDVTGKAQKPYINLSDQESILPVKEYLYNFQTVKDAAVVTEGVTDVWRCGNGFVATLGNIYTPAQVQLLGPVRRKFIMFDAGKSESILAEKMAYDLSNNSTHTEIIELSEGDPCDLNEEDVKHLRRQIFGRIY